MSRNPHLAAALTVLFVALAVTAMAWTPPVVHEDRPPGEAELSGPLVANESGFYASGSVSLQLSRSDVSFEHVMLCLYDENETIIKAIDVGTLTTPNSKVNVTVRTETIPKYVLVDHPRFREYPSFEHELYVYLRSENLFSHTYTSDVRDFEYPKSDTVGECA